MIANPVFYTCQSIDMCLHPIPFYCMHIRLNLFRYPSSWADPDLTPVLRRKRIFMTDGRSCPMSSHAQLLLARPFLSAISSYNVALIYFTSSDETSFHVQWTDLSDSTMSPSGQDCSFSCHNLRKISLPDPCFSISITIMQQINDGTIPLSLYPARPAWIPPASPYSWKGCFANKVSTLARGSAISIMASS